MCPHNGISLMLFHERNYESRLCPPLSYLQLAGWQYARDLPFSMFMQTFIFVTYNKVCTSQVSKTLSACAPLVFLLCSCSHRKACFMIPEFLKKRVSNVEGSILLANRGSSLRAGVQACGISLRALTVMLCIRASIFSGTCASCRWSWCRPSRPYESWPTANTWPRPGSGLRYVPLVVCGQLSFHSLCLCESKNVRPMILNDCFTINRNATSAFLI